MRQKRGTMSATNRGHGHGLRAATCLNFSTVAKLDTLGSCFCAGGGPAKCCGHPFFWGFFTTIVTLNFVWRH